MASPIRHQTIERRGGHSWQAARGVGLAILEAAVLANTDPEAPMRLALLQNEIANGALEASEDVPMHLTDSEKTQHSNEWRTFRERNAHLAKHRGQTYSLILGQCSQLLKDKMKQDGDWPTVSISYDPLTLYRLIKKTILAQTEDQYPFATVYDQEMSFYGYRQDNFYGGVDEGEAILQINVDWVWQVTETLTYTQVIQYWPSLTNSGEFLLVWNSTFSLPISERWSFELIIQDKYNSQPVAGNEENDFAILLTLSFDFTNKADKG